MKVVTIIGARPQFIKAATVSREFKEAGIEEIIVHTGQHHDPNMSDVFFQEMEIPLPHHHLNVHGLSHGAMTGRMLEGIENVVKQTTPDYVLVYGDTNSTLAGALAAAKLHIPVAHVEAGLRSFNMRMPEEINRILTDRISQKLFCPTATAVRNLEAEGFRHFGIEIHQCGDVMFDSVLFYRERARKLSTILQRERLKPGAFILATLHRAENTDDLTRLREILHTLNQIQATTEVVMPIHPRTRKLIEQHQLTANLHLIDPVGYFDMLSLLENCSLVMTDSGGLQKESYFFNKFCITLRDQTEWVELVESGANVLTGANGEMILAAFAQHAGRDLPPSGALYGDGHAARTIVSLLQS